VRLFNFTRQDAGRPYTPIGMEISGRSIYGAAYAFLMHTTVSVYPPNGNLRKQEENNQ
jgi:hypothetical protein